MLRGYTALHRERSGDLLWWTWAGTAANRTLHASLPGLVDSRQRIGGLALRLRSDLDLRVAAASLRGATEADLVDPAVDPDAVSGLKVSAALPPELATRTVAERLGDRGCAAAVLAEPRHVVY